MTDLDIIKYHLATKEFWLGIVVTLLGTLAIWVAVQLAAEFL
jgi:hypothetical protein|tara:strand:+ start:488 stop:613 length:126 start_codon:yes stop_codon:yes gene_type:complete